MAVQFSTFVGIYTACNLTLRVAPPLSIAADIECPVLQTVSHGIRSKGEGGSCMRILLYKNCTRTLRHGTAASPGEVHAQKAQQAICRGFIKQRNPRQEQEPVWLGQPTRCEIETDLFHAGSHRSSLEAAERVAESAPLVFGTLVITSPPFPRPCLSTV